MFNVFWGDEASSQLASWADELFTPCWPCRGMRWRQQRAVNSGKNILYTFLPFPSDSVAHSSYTVATLLQVLGNKPSNAAVAHTAGTAKGLAVVPHGLPTV